MGQEKRHADCDAESHKGSQRHHQHKRAVISLQFFLVLVHQLVERFRHGPKRFLESYKDRGGVVGGFITRLNDGIAPAARGVSDCVFLNSTKQW
jgi:hypothetical protein